MIPKIATKHIESNLGEVEVTQFSVAINSKTFSILTDNLYENKIQSLLRELCSNAYDSHVEAGKADVPFKVTLPTFLSPDFKIRDYGVGMDHKTVMTVYTTMFDTTKDHSNDFTGYIGIGSKVPFAYVNTFTVTAFDEGIKRVYVVSMNEQDIPEISSLGSFESDEPVGIEISLSAKPSDESMFTHEAGRVFMAYPVKPECNVEIPEPEILLQGDGWSVFNKQSVPSTTHIGSNIVFVKQGTVLYPYESKNVGFSYRTNGLFIVDMPIGSVEVSSSRESLSLDDETTEVVNKKIESAIEQAFRMANDEIMKAGSWRDACLLYNKYSNFLVSSYNHPGHDLIRQRHKSEPDLTTYNIPLWLEADRVRVYSIHYKTKSEILPKNPYNKVPLHAPISYQPSKKKFVIDRRDAPVKRRIARVNEYLGGTNGVFIENPTNDDLEKLCRLYNLTHDDLISIHNVPDPGAPDRSGTTGEVRGVYNMDNCRFTQSTMPDNYMWVALSGKRSTDIDRMRVDLGDETIISARAFRGISRSLNQSVGSIRWFFVTETVAKKLPAEFSFQSFWKKQLDKEDLESQYRKYKLRRAIEGEFKFPVEWLNKHYPVPVAGRHLLDIYELLNSGYTEGQIKLRSSIQDNNTAEVEKLSKKYPLLMRSTIQNDKAISDYIKMCEINKETK